jgi:hypothetical protein
MSPRDRTRRQPTPEDTIRATRRAQALPEIDAVDISPSRRAFGLTVGGNVGLTDRNLPHAQGRMVKSRSLPLRGVGRGKHFRPPWQRRRRPGRQTDETGY